MKIIVAPRDEREYHSWEDLASPAAVVREQCNTYSSDKLSLEAYDGDIGAGADFPIVVLRILEIGGLILLGIPAVHKKIRETLAEWRKIKQNLDKFLSWLAPKRPIHAYSIEISLLYALEHLSKTVKVEDLELVRADEILGVCGYPEPSFENSELAYFEFQFRDSYSFMHILILDWNLNVVVEASLPLHPAMR